MFLRLSEGCRSCRKLIALDFQPMFFARHCSYFLNNHSPIREGDSTLVCASYQTTWHNLTRSGDEHPFTSYFEVHQGYKVLTHCHIRKIRPLQDCANFTAIDDAQISKLGAKEEVFSTTRIESMFTPGIAGARSFGSVMGYPVGPEVSIHFWVFNGDKMDHNIDNMGIGFSMGI